MSVRIQFDLEDEEWERISRFVRNKKSRHDTGYNALMEWCTRKEGRDKRLNEERILKDRKFLEPIVRKIMRGEYNE